ncbi:MAG TPA: FAD/NAD(P)-binding oxidoreductase [Gemmatimonadales bacterium]|nr:FAD/NAD(P)-binding oxidoreductase [Gemmatimonadales bacterium]
MAEIVIVGGGVGGVVAAKRLRRSLGGGHRVTVIDRARDHLFQPSLLWVADGTRRPERLSRPLSRLNRRGVSFRFGAVQGLDLSARRVRLDDGEVPYDYLLLSPGAELRPEALPGLAEAGRDLYTLDGAAGLNADLSRFQGGRLGVLVAAMPFKCPAAPYEAAMLLEARLRAQGVRGRCEVAVYTPEPQPMPVAGPALGAAVREMLTSRGIAYFPGHKPVTVEPGSRTIRFEKGEVARYDLLAYVPPHAAPAFVVEAGLAPAGGWVTVDPKTLATPFERVWAVGDVTAIPLLNGKLLPKAGVFAEGEAEIVARNIAALVRGAAPAAEFGGEGACFVEMGGGRAGFATGNFYATPDPVVRLKTPGRRWHWAKVLFERTWFRRWL